MHQILRLLSDSTRVRILAAVEPEELAVNEIAEVLEMSQSRISNHLRLLRGADALHARRDGAWTFYRCVLGQQEQAAPLWEVVKQGLSDDPALRADRERRDAVLEQRRRRSRDHFASGDAGTELAVGSLREELLATFAPRNAVAVDAGCGNGYLTEVLAQRFDTVLAFDHSSRQLEAARRRVSARNVRFKQADVENIPLPDASCDVVFLSLVLHHVPQIPESLREAARILRPGGRVVVADLAPHDVESMREQMGDLRLGLESRQVKQALTKAGFVKVDTLPARDRLVAESGRQLDLFIATGEKPAAPKRKRRKTKPNGSRS